MGLPSSFLLTLRPNLERGLGVRGYVEPGVPGIPGAPGAKERGRRLAITARERRGPPAREALAVARVHR